MASAKTLLQVSFDFLIPFKRETQSDQHQPSREAITSFPALGQGQSANTSSISVQSPPTVSKIKENFDVPGARNTFPK